MLIPKLSALGFSAVALRPRRGAWDIESPWFQSASAAIAAAAAEHEMALVIDLDAPFFDDPDCREPFSLASLDDRQRDQAIARVEQWIRQTAPMCPAAVTFSSGRVRAAGHGDQDPDSHGEETLERLAAAISPLAQLASTLNVAAAIRPVAGHAIATVAQFERFGQWLGSDTSLGLAADVGEMLLGGEFPIGARLARLQHRLTCVYLCEPDLERGCDQRFGHGDIDLRRVWEVMTQSGFGGPAIFRACGHGRFGMALAAEALALLDQPA
ncbi:sugar phosphate isomerase/epimerase [Stieleria sp. TO1_6]|uniref:sugar phosphate isomerase/epimerase family protein n=1 Tax=Stieleria tagensis TaxID=2956795 RepID=UPI00209A6997|nr:TIM barrel protein [Stieleria tagensis]MCO8125045.1 sugar phosphate isomerase/epimerase [Stieleria tagensis]